MPGNTVAAPCSHPATPGILPQKRTLVKVLSLWGQPESSVSIANAEMLVSHGAARVTETRRGVIRTVRLTKPATEIESMAPLSYRFTYGTEGGTQFKSLHDKHGRTIYKLNQEEVFIPVEESKPIKTLPFPKPTQ